MGECFLHFHSSISKGLPKFTYSGEYRVNDEGNKNWNIQFLTSGVLKFIQRKGATRGIDVFLVGGGNSGANGNVDTGGGRGGNGGEAKTISAKPALNTEYKITVGGSGESTSGFGNTAAAGGGANGGSGGANSQYNPSGGKGSDGTYAFNDTSYARYGAGGGGGVGVWLGADGVDGTGGKGGDYGGGNGGTSYYNASTAGLANTGGGGGGGYAAGGSGSPGGSGIVIIRNKRS